MPNELRKCYDRNSNSLGFNFFATNSWINIYFIVTRLHIYRRANKSLA